MVSMPPAALSLAVALGSLVGGAECGAARGDIPASAADPAAGEPDVLLPSLGTVRGIRWQSKGRRPYYAFLKVPFAAPPVGELRFSRPQPPAPWEGVRRNTLNDSVWCAQMDFQEQIKGVEDCLYLNVYVPAEALADGGGSGKKAVMVWIHGGGFFAGSGNPQFYGPDLLMDYDVVMVSINYRLGPLAFLTLENDMMPGNLGLRDQLMALQWVQENIRHFGGNPDRVTVFGESAGSMSIFFLMLSPMSRGLFHGIIGQSGPFISSYLNWDKRPALYGIRFAEALGCTGQDTENDTLADPRDNSDARTEAILQCLRDKQVLDFPVHMPIFFHYPWTGPNVWKPCWDGHYAKDPLFPEEPYNLLEHGKYMKVPVIIGANRNEGIMNVIGYLRGISKLDDVEERWPSLGPLIMFHRSLDETMPEDVKLAKSIKKHYFGNRTVCHDTLKSFINLMGDHSFYGGIELMIQLMLQHHSPYPIYHYMYDHMGTITMVEGLLLPEWRLLVKWIACYFGLDFSSMNLGVGHGDELLMMFVPRLQTMVNIDLMIVEKDRAVSRSILTYWTNFAKHGQPNRPRGADEAEEDDAVDSMPTWEPVTPHSRMYMNITTNQLKMDSDENFRDRSRLWGDIIRRVRSYRNFLSDKMPLFGSEIENWLQSQDSYTDGR